VSGPTDEAGELPARRSPYIRILIGVTIGLVIWLLLPQLPRDQTVIFALGPDSERLARLDVQWETVGSESSEHEGSVTLNFPAPTPDEPTPERVVRQFRLVDGEYVFRVSGVRRGEVAQRTEVTRQVTLDGNAVTLRLEELSH
jgi:hypothetical protein